MDAIGNSVIPVFAFYLLIFCNFTPQIIGCRLQELLQTNIYVKHIISFILLLLLIILVNPDLAANKLANTILFTVFIYIMFLLTTRSPLYITFTVLGLLLIAYLLNTTKAKYKDDPTKQQQLQKIQNNLAAFSFVLSAIGFVIYTIEKRREYGAAFDWLKYFTGDIKCKYYTPSVAKIVRI